MENIIASKRSNCMTPSYRETRKRAAGPAQAARRRGYGKTLTVWVPKLRDGGVDEKTLHGLLVDNPRRFLAFVA
jgi:predicted metal-dependent phosphotriesterase family hydrolase